MMSSNEEFEKFVSKVNEKRRAIATRIEYNKEWLALHAQHAALKNEYIVMEKNMLKEKEKEKDGEHKVDFLSMLDEQTQLLERIDELVARQGLLVQMSYRNGYTHAFTEDLELPFSCRTIPSFPSISPLDTSLPNSESAAAASLADSAPSRKRRFADASQPEPSSVVLTDIVDVNNPIVGDSLDDAIVGDQEKQPVEEQVASSENLSDIARNKVSEKMPLSQENYSESEDDFSESIDEEDSETIEEEEEASAEITEEEDEEIDLGDDESADDGPRSLDNATDQQAEGVRRSSRKRVQNLMSSHDALDSAVMGNWEALTKYFDSLIHSSPVQCGAPLDKERLKEYEELIVAAKEGLLECCDIGGSQVVVCCMCNTTKNCTSSVWIAGAYSGSVGRYCEQKLRFIISAGNSIRQVHKIHLNAGINKDRRHINFQKLVNKVENAHRALLDSKEKEKK